jgi:pseudaminic acid cytidylyltransferase
LSFLTFARFTVDKLCIIPARGGSKRIPRKNIRLFRGKPMMAYAIECAKQSQLFDRIIVSTDDVEIAKIAADYGAEVPFFRSAKNSDDYTTTSDVLVEVLKELEKSSALPSWACCLYPTTPLIFPSDLSNAFELHKSTDSDVVLSAVAFDFPIQRAFELNLDNSIRLREPEAISKRSQDLEPTYHDAGAFYFFNTRRFLQSNSLWSGKVTAIPLPAERVQDIDNPSDWDLAEYKYQFLYTND